MTDTQGRNFHAQLRAAVRAAMSQGVRLAAMADAIGMGPQHLSLYLSGARRISIERAEKLAEAAGARIIIEPINAHRRRSGRALTSETSRPFRGLS